MYDHPYISDPEYTTTLRDLTGIATLDPAREFPVDGAAGEGFTNVGNALVMSPTLLAKYLDAGKDLAGHAVLLPDGIRFSAGTTRRDWTEELLSEIRDLYREFTDASGADVVDLQGIVFATNEGGRLPLASRRVAGARIEYIRGARRRGDDARLVASSKRAAAVLGWKPRHDRTTILESAWRATYGTRST